MNPTHEDIRADIKKAIQNTNARKQAGEFDLFDNDYMEDVADEISNLFLTTLEGLKMEEKQQDNKIEGVHDDVEVIDRILRNRNTAGYNIAVKEQNQKIARIKVALQNKEDK